MYTPDFGYTSRVKHPSLFCLVLLLILSSTSLLGAQELDWDALRGSEEFRWGVQAYHNGLFDSALLSFERALSFSDTDSLYKQWLGRAYHRLGLDATAIALWREVLGTGEGSALLQQRVDVIAARGSLERERASRQRYVLGETLKGQLGDFTLFSRPVGLETWPDGSYYLASFTGNEVYHFNLNGALQQTLQGGLLGFSQPFDILRYTNEKIYVSEFGADRIAYCRPDGSRIVRFGEKGNGPGQLSGPQYLSRDDEGYVYVSEAGNRRISKFSPEGEFILSFGRRTEGFPGFLAPSGIVVEDGVLIAADSRRKRLYGFDTSGNFLFEAGDEVLQRPEGLSLLDPGLLLVADGGRLMVFNIASRSFELLANVDGNGRRIIDAVRDVNGNILVSDFNSDEIGVLSELSAMYSGVFVEIERIDSSRFPEVFLDVSVHDRLGKPITGLRESNFILSESHGLPGSPALLAQGDAMDELEVAIVIERSAYTAGREDELAAGVDEIVGALPAGSRVRLYSAGSQPLLEVPAGRSRTDYRAAAARPEQDQSVAFAYYEALRMASLELAPLRGRKLLISIGSGREPVRSSGGASPSAAVTASLMSTNGIRYAYVPLEAEPESQSFDYMARETSGGIYYLYRPAGIAPIIGEYATKPTGRYYLKIISQLDPDYGNRYLPVEVEVAYYNRTGRDEFGYYAPPPYN